MATTTNNQDPVSDVDFLDTPDATQLATAYQAADDERRNDGLFLVCLFLALNI